MASSSTEKDNARVYYSEKFLRKVSIEGNESLRKVVSDFQVLKQRSPYLKPLKEYVASLIPFIETDNEVPEFKEKLQAVANFAASGERGDSKNDLFQKLLHAAQENKKREERIEDLEHTIIPGLIRQNNKIIAGFLRCHLKAEVNHQIDRTGLLKSDRYNTLKDRLRQLMSTELTTENDWNEAKLVERYMLNEKAETSDITFLMDIHLRDKAIKEIMSGEESLNETRKKEDELQALIKAQNVAITKLAASKYSTCIPDKWLVLPDSLTRSQENLNKLSLKRGARGDSNDSESEITPGPSKRPRQ